MPVVAQQAAKSAEDNTTPAVREIYEPGMDAGGRSRVVSAVFALISPDDIELVRGPNSVNIEQVTSIRGMRDVSIDEKKMHVTITGYDQAAVNKAKSLLEIGHETLPVEKRLFEELIKTNLDILTTMAGDLWHQRGVRLVWTRPAAQKGKRGGQKASGAGCKITVSGLRDSLGPVMTECRKLLEEVFRASWGP